MENKYHRAAQDGILETLKPISKKECNAGDEDGMSPTLWAAFEGNLEALRLLLSKGGDPEKTDTFGNTSLHLAAAQGHHRIVSLLVNFGVNIWALDIDLHTARQLAGMNGRDEVLAYLDSVHAKAERDSPSKVRKLKDKADKAIQKLLKNYKKCQISHNAIHPHMRRYDEKESSRLEISKNKRRKDPLTYSEMTGTLSMEPSSSLILKKLQKSYGKIDKEGAKEFKIRSKADDGTLKITNLSGYKRDSEIIFVAPGNQQNNVPSFIKPKRKEIAGIFERPGFGSVAFRSSASLFSFPLSTTLEEGSGSIGSAGSFAERIDFDDLSLEERPKEDIDVLLCSLGLSEFSDVFHSEKVDIEALSLLSEEDLKSMNIPIGARRKLLKAIDERKEEIHESIIIKDSSL
eukprot:TRINITY_DN5008_c0_g1_i1.p1 TRINITY_DN5008_c0_g1~~TRINITY_DN5008_c0_g1_i1.p1  ORF type:complete len:403 (-),score=114.62 TRINITY_DN5008_c0_g1_i1:697-1905(-)